MRERPMMTIANNLEQSAALACYMRDKAKTLSERARWVKVFNLLRTVGAEISQHVLETDYEPDDTDGAFD